MSTTVDDLIEVKDTAVGVCFEARELANALLTNEHIAQHLQEFDLRVKVAILHAHAFEACAYSEKYDAAEEDPNCYEMSDLDETS